MSLLLPSAAGSLRIERDEPAFPWLTHARKAHATVHTGETSRETWSGETSAHAVSRDPRSGNGKLAFGQVCRSYVREACDFFREFRLARNGRRDPVGMHVKFDLRIELSAIPVFMISNVDRVFHGLFLV